MSRAPYGPIPGSISARAIEHLKKLPPGTQLTSADLADAIATETSSLQACLFWAVRNGLLTVGKRPGTRLSLWSLGPGSPMAPPALEDDDLGPDERPEPVDAAEVAARVPRSVFEVAQASAEVEKPEVAEEASLPSPPKPANALGWIPAPTPMVQKINIDPVGTEELAAAVLASASSAASAAAPALSTEHARELSAALTSGISQPPRPPKAGPFSCALWSDGRLQLQRGDTEILTLTVDETRQLVAYLERLAVPS